jgi:hypothetical protein
VFAGLEVRVRGKRGPLCGYEDSNGDGYTDLVCHFEDDAAMWSPGSTDACVEGSLLEAYGGLTFRGCDSMCVVP